MNVDEHGFSKPVRADISVENRKSKIPSSVGAKSSEYAAPTDDEKFEDVVKQAQAATVLVLVY